MRTFIQKIFYIFLFTLFFYNPVVYSKNILNTSLLTQDQQIFLKELKVIKKCVDPHWMPLEAIDPSGTHIGIIADISKLIEDELGLLIELVKTDSWLKSINKLRQKQCDIVTSDTINENAKRHFLQTLPFLDLNLVYITRNDSPTRLDFSVIKNKTLAVVQGYPIIPLIKEKYKNIKIIEVKNVDEGLLKVSKGEIYAFSDLLPVSSYYIQQLSLTNLWVAGHLDISVPIVMDVRTDMPELVEIINEVILSLETSQIDQLLSKWIKIEYQTKLDWKSIVNYSLIFITILSLILYWSRRIHILNKKLNQTNEQLYLLNETDSLTKLKNRNYLDDSLPNFISHAKHMKQSLSVAMLDIDHFKQINDKYGHNVGDICLASFSEKLQQAFGSSNNHIIRYGGEEFLIVSTNSNFEVFSKQLEAFRHEIEQSVILEGEIKIQYTVSIGLCFYPTAPDWHSDCLIEADKNLYHAKASGRNRLISNIIS